MSETLPCPHCGATTRIAHPTNEDYQAKCTSPYCGATSSYEATPELAAERWNAVARIVDERRERRMGEERPIYGRVILWRYPSWSDWNIDYEFAESDVWDADVLWCYAPPVKEES